MAGGFAVKEGRFGQLPSHPASWLDSWIAQILQVEEVVVAGTVEQFDAGVWGLREDVTSCTETTV